MGAQIAFTEQGLQVKGGDKLVGIDIDLHDVGELTPSIAAVASLATSPSVLRNIGHLRLHETDRLAALATEINKLGGDVVESPNDLAINPKQMKSNAKSDSQYIFLSYDDHRMATAGAIIGLAVAGIVVENIETTKKTLPDFPGMWQKLLGI